MKRAMAMVLICSVVAGCGSDVEVESLSAQEISALAACLSERGWIMFGSQLCPACRAQTALFGDSSGLITVVECNPNVEGGQPQRCIDRRVRRTPTWIRVVDGEAAERIETFQTLAELMEQSRCGPAASL